MKATPCRTFGSATERHVVARKRHVCAWCGGAIEPGMTYVVATEYPGGESGYADTAGHPVRMSVHVDAPCHHHGGAE